MKIIIAPDSFKESL
ncbi:putative glycerate kinase 2, partial [Yersinia pestis PY-15]